MIKIDEFLQEAIPSSFVYSNLKMKTDSGSGEAKLHIGSKLKEDNFRTFFNNYVSSNTYYFERNNMVDFMKYLKLEYSYQKINQYKDVDLSYYNELFSEITSMEEGEFKFRLTEFSDQSRYYIRSENNIFKKVFRKIALPLISNLRIEKYMVNGNIEYVFLLEPNFNYNKDIVLVSPVEEILFAKNRILFGAPGTGKSYRLEKDREGFGRNYERVTFHPNYSYSQFVGVYKPVPAKEINAKGIEVQTITYKYVPGPFIRTYVKAMESNKGFNPEPFLLIIEEINRANVAAVFGEVFQLLDRKNGESEYGIETSEDMRAYLKEKLGGEELEYEKIKIPSNMYIWATMNSADQGVFPMDTAFRRRWDFEYIGINEQDGGIEDIKVILGKDENKHIIRWNLLRRAINDKLSGNECNINEDKLLGPYFLSKEIIETSEDGFVVDNNRFIEVFKNKVLMYLYEDAAKQHKSKVFANCNHSKYSSVCDAFDVLGSGIFGEDIKSELVEGE